MGRLRPDQDDPKWEPNSHLTDDHPESISVYWHRSSGGVNMQPVEHYCQVCQRVVSLGTSTYIGSLKFKDREVELHDCPSDGCDNTLAEDALRQAERMVSRRPLRQGRLDSRSPREVRSRVAQTGLCSEGQEERD